MDELYARFMPQFLALARERMQRAREAAARPADGPPMTEIVRDLHSIAGEAGLLGLPHLVPLARSAEEQAKRLRDGPPDTDTAGLVGALDELGAAIDAVGAPGTKE